MLVHKCLGARADRMQRCSGRVPSSFAPPVPRTELPKAPARHAPCKQQLKVSALQSPAPTAGHTKAGLKGDRTYLLSISGPPSSLLPDTIWCLDPLSTEGDLVGQGPELQLTRQEEQYELSPQAAAARAEARELRALLEIRQQELAEVKAELAAEKAGREDLQRQYQQVVAAKDVQLQQLFAFATESERERAELQNDLAEVQSELSQLKQVLQARLAAAAAEERRQQEQAASAMGVLGELHALSRSMVEDSRRDEHENEDAASTGNGSTATSNGSNNGSKPASNGTNGSKTTANGSTTTSTSSQAAASGSKLASNGSSSGSRHSNDIDLLVSTGYGETGLSLGRLFGRNESAAAVAGASANGNGNGRH